MKVLITGASGFLGRNLSEYLKNSCQLFLPSHNQLDLEDERATEDYLRANNFDVVIHCAARGISRKNNTPDALMANLSMFSNLARLNTLYGKMIFIGSGAEYDKRRDLSLVTEQEFGQFVPVDPYGFAKYLCSQIINSIPNIINLRCFAVFGKYEDYETRFISNTICRGLFNLPVVINQDVKFDYFSVDDFCKVTEYFINNESKLQFYNVGSGQGILLTEIVRKIEDLFGKKMDVTVKSAGLNKEYTCNNSRLLAEMPNFKFMSFDEALANLYNWYIAHKDTIDSKKLLFDK